MQRISTRIHSTMVLAVLAGACSQETSEPGAPLASASVSDPTGDVPKAITVFSYDVAPSGASSPPGPAVTTTISKNPASYLCVMSRLTGRLELYGDLFSVLPKGDRYETKVGGAPFGTVKCVAHSHFVTDPGGEHWLSESVRVHAEDGATDEADLWWGSAASFVTNVMGRFRGGGEVLQIQQSTAGDEPSVFVARAQSRGVWGDALSYLAGVPRSGRLVRLYGFRNGSWVRGTVNSAGTFEYNVSTTSGFSSYWLPPRDKAFCYLTKLGGQFDGGGEALEISENGSQWVVGVRSGGGQSVRGAVRCMAYDQRS
jgi:hypothetical protein